MRELNYVMSATYNFDGNTLKEVFENTRTNTINNDEICSHFEYYFVSK